MHIRLCLSFVIEEPVLTLSMLEKNISRQHFEIFFLIFAENRIWPFMQIFSYAWYIKSPFSMENLKNVISLSSTELAQRVVNVEGVFSVLPVVFKMWRITGNTVQGKW